ncbi:MAG: Lrp/AsnC family transcriptional regulator [Rhodospirillales bacterium]|nr:Lrp/AsnC family transcriptional regulator [Rhodospirillales bacterium]
MLDRFDLRILEAWQRRGDTGPVEMSEAVGLSPSQCSRRMQRLKEAGYVRAITAVLEGTRLGIGLSAYVLLTMRGHDPATAEAFRARVMLLDEVLECQKLTGAADMILKIATRDLASFNDLLTRNILAAPEVATAQSSIILESVKSTTALALRFAGEAFA